MQDSTSAALPGFDDAALLAAIDVEVGHPEQFDDYPFGIVVMDRSGTVLAYNSDEARRAGLSRDRVLGRHFFTDIGPCTNNYLVAQRYEDATEQGIDLDEQLDYVFTFRMRPTPVRLRLLAAAGSPRQFLVVRSR